MPKWEPNDPRLMLGDISGSNRRIPSIDEASLNASLKYATGVLARQERVEMNLVASDIAPEKHSPAHSQYLHHYANDEAMDKAVDALVVIGASSQLAQTQCSKYVPKLYDLILCEKVTF